MDRLELPVGGGRGDERKHRRGRHADAGLIVHRKGAGGAERQQNKRRYTERLVGLEDGRIVILAAQPNPGGLFSRPFSFPGGFMKRWLCASVALIFYASQLPWAGAAFLNYNAHNIVSDGGNISGVDNITGTGYGRIKDYSFGSASYTDNGYFGHINGEKVVARPVVNLAEYAAGDNTDIRTSFQSALDNTPSGGTLFVPCADNNSYYNVSGGFIRNTPIRILGAGTCSHIRTTGTTTFAGLFYMGGAVPNGTPNPDFAAGTSLTFTGALTAGQTILTGFSSTTGVSAGDDVYLALGQDHDTDPGQYAYRMFNRVRSTTSSTVTVEVPIPETISGTFSADYTFSPTSHILHKYTVNPDLFEVGNLRISSSVNNTENMLFALRARNIYFHDLFFDNTNVGSNSGVIDVGESENVIAERIYAQNTGGLTSYANRNASYRDIFLRQLNSSGLYLENQPRGFTAENWFIESGLDHGTQQLIFLGGNIKRVHLRNFTFNNIQTGNVYPYFVFDNTYNNRYSLDDVITENFYFNGNTDNVGIFYLGQHRGILFYDNVTYRDLKRFRKTITLDNGLNAQAFNLLDGIIVNMKVATDNLTGVSVVKVMNSVTSNEYTLYDPGNSWNMFPTEGTFGKLHTDAVHLGMCIGAGVTDCKWNQAGMKQILVYTTTVSPGAKLIFEIEAYVKDDDGVNGAYESTE